MIHLKNKYALVADIGGTNTRVALANSHQIISETIRRYSNEDYFSLENVLRHYINEEGGVDPIAACVAVAGPVRDGRAKMTNLNWTIDENTLANATKADNVVILNDLQAQGHALGHINDAYLTTIIDGPTSLPQAAQLVIGVGTGFNVAPVFDTEQGRLVTPSESGHVNLPIRTERELKLSQFVSKGYGFTAIEDVVSGRGLERIYAFLSEEAGSPAEASAKVIMAACADESNPQASEAAHIFTRILGTVCGDMSLIHLPFGGIHLAGGVARAFAPYLAEFGFVDAFYDKGRFAGFMGNFRVSVIEDDYAALIGSAAHLVALFDS